MRRGKMQEESRHRDAQALLLLLPVTKQCARALECTLARTERASVRFGDPQAVATDLPHAHALARLLKALQPLQQRHALLRERERG